VRGYAPDAGEAERCATASSPPDGPRSSGSATHAPKAAEEISVLNPRAQKQPDQKRSTAHLAQFFVSNN